VKVEVYPGVDVRLDPPVVLPPTLDVVDITGLRARAADGVADSGKTIALVREFIRPHVADARCALLYQNSRSVVDCEYIWRGTELRIDFPWSSRPPDVGSPGWDA
jgi:hypoxanthine phosphoribosyltransferase